MPPGEKISPLSDNSDHYNGTFNNKRKMGIYCYYWKPQIEPRALLLISHGYTEHSTLYEDLAKDMCSRGFFVFAHDHVGHGHSDGNRAALDNHPELVEDSVTHIKLMRQDYPTLPLFICGHSMGGAIAVLTALDKEVEASGIVLIAPALAPNPETATFFKMTVCKVLNKLAPTFPIVATDFKLCCRDDERIEFMKNDPLRYKGWWRVGPILNLLNYENEIEKRAEEVKVPLLILHGDNDKICDISGSYNLHEKSTSSDKTLKVYPGGYHSLLNEPDGMAKDCFDQIVNWLDSRA